MEFRRRFKQNLSLQDRLAAFARDMREKADAAAGDERESLLRRAGQADAAVHLQDWANSPGLQPPR